MQPLRIETERLQSVWRFSCETGECVPFTILFSKAAVSVWFGSKCGNDPRCPQKHDYDMDLLMGNAWRTAQSIRDSVNREHPETVEQLTA